MTRCTRSCEPARRMSRRSLSRSLRLRLPSPPRPPSRPMQSTRQIQMTRRRCLHRPKLKWPRRRRRRRQRACPHRHRQATQSSQTTNTRMGHRHSPRRHRRRRMRRLHKTHRLHRLLKRRHRRQSRRQRQRSLRSLSRRRSPRRTLPSTHRTGRGVDGVPRRARYAWLRRCRIRPQPTARIQRLAPEPHCQVKRAGISMNGFVASSDSATRVFSPQHVISKRSKLNTVPVLSCVVRGERCQ